MRILNFVKKSSKSTSNAVVYETYMFSYDGYNRVTQITHTKNDGSSNLLTTLDYSNDTIYSVTKYVNAWTVVERDTFITDQKGLITIAHEPTGTTKHFYSDKLITRQEKSASDYLIYTSYNANFLKAKSSVDTFADRYYTYYTDKFNRAGDYLQINSFLKYGYNFYQNDNLVWTIKKPFYKTNVDYELDADNKITRTTAVTTDTIGRTETEVYDFQYEQYK